jgi:hypothetical protein
MSNGWMSAKPMAAWINCQARPAAERTEIPLATAAPRRKNRSDSSPRWIIFEPPKNL